MSFGFPSGWRRAISRAFLGVSWALLLCRAGGSAQAQVVAEFSAAAGQVSAPFVVKDGVVFQPVAAELTSAGRAVYTFTVTNAGFFIVEAWVEAAGTNSNSLFVSIDDEPDATASLWEIPVSAGVTNRIVALRKHTPAFKDASPALFKLASGEHKLIITGSKPNTLLSKLSIVHVAKPKPPGPLLFNAGGS